MKTYHFYTVVLISLLLVASIVSAEEPKSKWLNENPCMITVVITVHWSDFNDKVNVTKMVDKSIEIIKEGSK